MVSSLGINSDTLVFRRNPRARRYILRLIRNGSATVTIPRGGSLAEAQQFAERHRSWLERERLRLAALPHHPRQWTVGTDVLFHGEPVKLEGIANNAIRLGADIIPVPDAAKDMRPVLEQHLRKLASRELPPKVWDYAARHGLSIRRVTVRNQRSRWGSCSRSGTISLNWRLIQAPAFVCDYVILHELMHLREMNHSSRFWREVEQVCPDHKTARRWLTQHASLLQ